MADDPGSPEANWRTVLQTLSTDERITPQLHGFLGLVVPKGIMAGSFYLEVPNDLTRGMLEQRIRVPLLSALGKLDDSYGVTNFAVVVNPDIGGDEYLQPAEIIEVLPPVVRRHESHSRNRGAAA